MAIVREQVVQTAEKFVARGKIEAAIREYKKVLAENPNDTNTLNRVGDLYARIQRFDEAVDFFTQIAQQYTDEGFFVKAIAIYKKIIKLNPTQLEVYEKLAELYHKQGLVNEARTQYHVLADYYIKHENPTSAIAIYLKMAELEPENPTYHVKLAELYQQQKLTEKALQEHRIIAELMIAHGHPQEAAQVYERALDIDSSNVGFLTDAVMKLKAAGHADSARRLLTAAVERNPQAEKIGRLAGLDEPAPAAPLAPLAPLAQPTPQITAPAARQPEPEPDEEEMLPWGDRPVFPDEPAEETLYEAKPYVEDGDELGSGYTDFEVELDLDAELAPAVFETPAPAAPTAPAPLAAKPAFEPAAEEFELDLDEVFVLDINDDDEPASLVKPPPDMLGEEVRRPAWAQGATPAAAPAAPVAEEAEEEEIVLDLDSLDEAPSFEPSFEQSFEMADFGGGGTFDFGALETPAAASPAELPVEELPGLEELDLGSEPAFQPEPELLAEAPPSPGAALPGAAGAAEPAAGYPIDHDLLERTAAELHPQVLQREEDLVSEAEVLAKYGLEDKALERLREALRLDPRHLGAFALMVQLHLDKGRHARVVELANQMAGAAAGARDKEPWLKVRRRLLTAGYRLDGDKVQASPVAGPERRAVPASAAPSAPAAPVPAAGPAGPAGPGSPAAAARRPGGAPGRNVDDMLRGLLTPGQRKAPAARPAAAVPPAAPSAPPPPAPAAEAAPPPVLAAAPPAAPVARKPVAPFNPLEIGQMVDMADLDEAPDFTPEPFALSPPAAASAPAGGQTVDQAAGSFLDDTGMSWLDEVEAGRRRPAAAGGLFSDEDDFFDLAGELEQELSKEAGLEGGELLAQPVEQSLEQIVEGFKKGVAENLSPTDYDTHFNLGIAYREMGLIDEAIGEFQLAAKSPALLVSCCSMLGLCFLEKGLPELAVKWYRRGLEAPLVSEDDSLGLLYDLGNVYETMGDRATAYKTFVELYGINTNYRDVVARIEDLGRAS
jgi:pilus assembly protein FimV